MTKHFPQSSYDSNAQGDNGEKYEKDKNALILLVNLAEIVHCKSKNAC